MMVEQRVIFSFNLHNPNELKIWCRSKQAYADKGCIIGEDTFVGVAEFRTTNWLELDWLEDEPEEEREMKNGRQRNN